MKLKTTTKVAFTIFIIMFATIFMSEYLAPVSADNPSPRASHTGSPADGQNCSRCHSGAPISTYSVSLTGLPSNGYISGQTYTMTATMTSGKTSAIVYGFEVSPQTTSTTKTFIGTMATANTLTRMPATGYMTNTSKQGANATGYTWTFKWTAGGSANATAANATANKGNGYFYGCFVFANNDNTDNGSDHPTITSFPLTENVTASNSISASTTTICSGSSVTFTVTPVNEGTSPSYQWNVNGTATYTTTGTTYTTSSLNNGDVVTCVLTSSKAGVSGSPATSTNSITMAVNPSPTITGTTPASRCDAGVVTLGATASTGTINWYAASSGGPSLATGSSYTTTSISSTTTYYVDATANGCTSSSRTALTATVNNTPAVPTASVTTSPVCEGANILLNASSSTGGVSYSWTGPNSFSSSTQNPPIGGATQAMAGTYSVTATLNGCTSAAGTTSVAVTVPATPSVSIAVTAGSNTTCSGQSITFTATPSNGGSSPNYNWQVNGSSVQSGASGTYSSSSLLNSDEVRCVLTSNASCVSTTTATSNTVTMAIVPKDTPDVSIQITNGDNQICTGQLVQFQATPTFGGTSPNYQWKVNGSNVGTGTDTLQTTALANSDVVTCILTSNAACLTTQSATSNSIAMSVTGIVTPAISVALNNGSNPSCEGESITFKATSSGGGSSPTYQWLVNGVNAGTNSSLFTPSALINGQLISCNLISSSGCASPSTASSNTITMSVTSTVVPTVSISVTSGGNPSCAGQPVTLTANPTNGGSNPTYDWAVNGTTIQSSTTATYTSSNLASSDVVTCVMTPLAATCATPNYATSNSITMTVTAIPSPALVISTNSNPSCINDLVTFTSVATDPGTSPSYQWQVNGANVGVGTNTYQSTTFSDGEMVSCVLTSNAVCATTTTVSSNQVIMSVQNVYTPTVTVNGSTPICEGASSSFTAVSQGEGSSPTFVWYLDGSPVIGATGTTYSPASVLTNGQTVRCELTSSSSCASPAMVSSNALTMVVTSTVTPSVNISVGSNPLCAGSSTTFTAMPINGGLSPSYQWKLNGNNVGSDTDTYIPISITNNDQITCVLSSNAACVTTATAVATAITMTINPITNPSISIFQTSGNNPTCTPGSVEFTAIGSNAGANPTYQWKLNGSDVGTNSNVYSPSGLSNNDLIACVLTSSDACASTQPISSTITMSITPAVTPAISIAITNGTNPSPQGSSVTYSVTSFSNEGTSPTYQWKVDGANVGTLNNMTYTSSSLTNGQTVSCELTSDISCVTQSTVDDGIVMSISATVAPTISQNDAGQVVVLTSSSVTGNQWYYNGVAIPGATGQSYPADKNGVYYVVVTDGTGSALQSAPAGIAVPVTISKNGNTLTSSSAASNQWYIDGLLIPGATESTLDITQNGSYKVVVTINGVSSETTILVDDIGATTGIDLLRDQTTTIINVLPNPNSGMFNVLIDFKDRTDYVLEIINSLGQVVYSEALNDFGGEYNKQILIESGKGVYFLSVKSNTMLLGKKIIVY